MTDKKNKIQDYIQNHLLPRGRKTGQTDILFSNGTIDSLGVLQLIAWLEKEFQIRIDTRRHELTDFDTVERTAELVDRLSTNANGR